MQKDELLARIEQVRRHLQRVRVPGLAGVMRGCLKDLDEMEDLIKAKPAKGRKTHQPMLGDSVDQSESDTKSE